MGMKASKRLSVGNLTVTKNGKTLLKNLSFDVKEGELLGVIGPNGAGKSTLLKAIVGYYPHITGTIQMGADSVPSMSHPQRASLMAYMAQRAEATLPFTVAETIALGAYHQSLTEVISKKAMDLRLKEIAAELDITSLLNRKLTELSGGETQLVHFARIMMQQTPLMLLDEPTASLDIGHEAQLMNLLRHRCHQGQSALIANHNLTVAAAFCDRVLLIDHGEMIAIGTPETVITQANMNQLYGHQVIVSAHPQSGTVMVIPRNDISLR